MIVALHDDTAKEMINNQLQSEAVNMELKQEDVFSISREWSLLYILQLKAERKCKDKICSKLLSEAHLNSLMPANVVLFFKEMFFC